MARAYYTPNQMPDGAWRNGMVIIALPTCPYRRHDETGLLVPDDAANGGDLRVLCAGAINNYATGTATSRAGASCRETGRVTIHTGYAVDGTAGDCLAPVDGSINKPLMIVRGRDSGSFALASGTSLAAPQLARWLALQLSQGTVLKGRQEVRDLARQQFRGQNEPPIVQVFPSFPEF